MLSYRHAFHAGNYADLLKHSVLCSILRYLTQKDAPLRYIDTHAGTGAYNLLSPESNKTSEYQQGIGVLWGVQQLPELLADYRALVKEFNGGEMLSAYPGSPWFAQRLLRPYDRLELCELHPQDFPNLQRQMNSDKRVHCHFENGFTRSLALLPPVEKRGLVLMDPSYELKDDYQNVADHLKALCRRFATGVYMVWYPVVDERRIKTLCTQLKASGLRRIHRYELGISHDHSQPGMTGSGLIVVNPPWGLKERVAEALAFLQPLIAAEGQGYFHVEELVGE